MPRVNRCHRCWRSRSSSGRRFSCSRNRSNRLRAGGQAHAAEARRWDEIGMSSRSAWPRRRRQQPPPASNRLRHRRRSMSPGVLDAPTHARAVANANKRARAGTEGIDDSVDALVRAEADSADGEEGRRHTRHYVDEEAGRHTARDAREASSRRSTKTVRRPLALTLALTLSPSAPWSGAPRGYPEPT